ncbi:MAG: hypothetical protein NT075_30670 [Chloroflexi bacterium]|nr:hypothetical protein [Chloroflexota bacterium]
MSNEATSNGQGREIANVGVLDLTGLKAADELANVTAISNVGTILVRQSLAGTLAAIKTANVGLIVPIPDGEHVKSHILMGPVRMSGEALANPAAEGQQILVIMGPLTITTPVEKVGYDQMIVIGPVIAPYGSETALGAGITKLQGPMLFYPSGAGVKIQEGQVKLSGKALANANGDPEDVLVIIGHGAITSPVEKVGYKQIVVLGQLVAPRESQAELEDYLTVTGQASWYSGVPRLFNGNESFAAAFFEFLNEPITLIINGIAVIEADVTVELLRAKVTEIVLNGMLEGPKQLVPVLQALTIEKNGTISVTGEVSDDDA